MTFKTSATAFMLFLALSANAQKQVKAYHDLKSYVQQKFNQLDDVTIKERTGGEIAMSGGNDYKITGSDKLTSKDIKKNYWAIQCDSTLYLNCFVLMKNKWYAPVLYSSSKYLYFKAGTGNIKGGHQEAAAAGVMFGAIGGAAAATARYNYILDLETGEISPLNKKTMKEILASNTELQKKYIAANSPQDKDSYIQYLKELDGKRL